MRAVGREKVMSYTKRQDIISRNARYPPASDNARSVHTGAVDWFMEYATPTYVLMNKYTAMRLHCRRRMFQETAEPLFYILDICKQYPHSADARDILDISAEPPYYIATLGIRNDLFVTDSARLHRYVHMRDFYIRKWRYRTQQNLPIVNEKAVSFDPYLA
jgi:hypothetical protein